MMLSSASYLIFLALCLGVHALLPHRYRNFLLLLASAAFFIYAMPAQAIIVLLLCLSVYGVGFAINAIRGPLRKALLLLGLCLCLGVLLFYKYLGFLAELVGLNADGGIFSLAVPLGISYVSFQCISYLVEIYKGSMAPENSPVDFLVYALFFAKITAGPIEDPGKFLAQLKAPRSCSLRSAYRAILRITMGFIKKVAIADLLSSGVSAVFSADSCSGWSVVLAMIMYAIQLLCDFSGYTDIARGSAALFGIELTENFNSPYSAVSIRDYWRRWHISLSTWLRKYVYFPLGGSRVPTLRRYINIIVTFVICGLWHGASLTYVFWGLLNGLYQAFEIMLDPPWQRLRKRLGIPEGSKVLRFLAQCRTFALIALSRLFFRADSLSAAFSMLGSLFRSWGPLGEALSLCALDLPTVILVTGGLVCVKLLGRLLEKPQSQSGGSLLYICGVSAWAVILVFLVCTAAGSVSSFIYFEF